MARTEYLNDPLAPPPTTILVAATAYVEDPDGRLLLMQRSDTGRWALPGGVLELGERITDTAVRETRKETGVDIFVTGLIGVYSNPHHLLSDGRGEVRQQFSLCVRAHPRSGEPAPSSGSLDVRWFEPRALGGINIQPEMLLRIGHGLSNRAVPYLG